MRLRQLYEAPERKVAVAAFGRMNPPTIGHEKLANMIKSFDGDHYIFLSQTVKPKDNPLPFDVKLEFAKKFFPGINVGHPSVRTPIQMLQMLEKLGYTDIVYVAGSDRVASFDKLFNDYNGKEYNFNSIDVVSAGERDPDADGAEGMSASKMRAAAAAGDYEAFAQGVPRPELAQKMYDAVRTGMGIKDKETAEAQGDNPAKTKARLDYLKKHPKYTTGPEKDYEDKEAKRVKGRKSKYDTQMSFKLEDVSPKDEKKFHNELDDLVHKYFGDSPDEEKMKKKMKQVKEQQLNEGFPLIVLATALRMGGKALVKLLTSQGTKQVAKGIAKNTGKAALWTGKAVVKNPIKSALAYGAYEVYDTVSDAIEWLEELGVELDLDDLDTIIPLLGKLMVKYAIPGAAVIAALYGGKQLYDYAKKAGDPTDAELLAALEKDVLNASMYEKEDKKDSDPTKGFDAATMKALANLRAMYPNAKSEIAALLKAVSNNKNLIGTTDLENDIDRADLEDRLNKLEKAVKLLQKGKREAIEEFISEGWGADEITPYSNGYTLWHRKQSRPNNEPPFWIYKTPEEFSDWDDSMTWDLEKAIKKAEPIAKVNSAAEASKAMKNETIEEGDLVIDKGSLRQFLGQMIQDAVAKEDDIEKLSKVLKLLVGKQIKTRGNRAYTITSEDILEACSSHKRKRRG